MKGVAFVEGTWETFFRLVEGHKKCHRSRRRHERALPESAAGERCQDIQVILIIRLGQGTTGPICHKQNLQQNLKQNSTRVH